MKKGKNCNHFHQGWLSLKTNTFIKSLHWTYSFAFKDHVKPDSILDDSNLVNILCPNKYLLR